LTDDKKEVVVEVFVTGVSGKIGVDDDSARPSGLDQKLDQDPEVSDSE
jgi:hypothetical protein